jgi:hypothetical protein
MTMRDADALREEHALLWWHDQITAACITRDAPEGGWLYLASFLTLHDGRSHGFETTAFAPWDEFTGRVGWLLSKAAKEGLTITSILVTKQGKNAREQVRVFADRWEWTQVWGDVSQRRDKTPEGWKWPSLPQPQPAKPTKPTTPASTAWITTLLAEWEGQ